MQAIFWSVFNAGEQVSIIFLDSQIFDQVLVFSSIVISIHFIMLNVGMVARQPRILVHNFYTPEFHADIAEPC